MNAYSKRRVCGCGRCAIHFDSFREEAGKMISALWRISRFCQRKVIQEADLLSVELALSVGCEAGSAAGGCWECDGRDRSSRREVWLRRRGGRQKKCACERAGRATEQR